MSQDTEKCAKCGKLCGYDDNKGVWYGGGLAICGQCKGNLISRFCAFFGIEGVSSDIYGVTVEWQEMDRILSKIKRDDSMRVSYLITDKEMYCRTVQQVTPVEDDVSRNIKSFRWYDRGLPSGC